MKKLTRRRFLLTSATTLAFTSLAPRSWSQVVGANEDIRIAVIGVNGRGASHINEFKKIKGVRIVALCDVDLKVLDGRAKNLAGVKKYQDFRKLLEDKEIDAVSIATTNHSHSLITVSACQAEKDVYVEKPCSHNVFEGRKCVEAARKYKRIVQHGTQKRGSASFNQLATIVKNERYGKLLVAKGYCCKPRWSIGFKPVKDPPPNLDFDIWLGPAPKQPYHENLVHYNWHWFWDFGNGDIGNQGVHEMDVARWVSGVTLPKSVISLGGRYVNEPDYKDQGQTPNQMVAVYDFGGLLILFEVRGLVGKDPKWQPKVANEFYFEQGVIRGNKFYPKNSNEGEPLPKVDGSVNEGGVFSNFIDCVRSRKQENLNADILQGHLSSALCHLGNISYRLANEKRFEKPSDFSDNEVVGESIMMALENTKAIGVDPQKATLWIGPKLFFNPEKEKFINNPIADKLLTREYRVPFIVPEKV